jgi:hypothetical protein
MTDIAVYRDKAVWQSRNPILAVKQPGFERDTGKLKIGDGKTRWNSLPYQDTPPYVLPNDDETSVGTSPSSGGTGGSSNSQFIRQVANPTELAAYVASLPSGTVYIVAQQNPFDILRGVKP